MPYHMGGDSGWWMMGVGWLVWLVLLALAVTLVVWLVNRGGARTAPRDDSAETLLRQRFASGEIDAEEYERRLAILRK
jgi:putative membrane protein